MCVHKLFNGPFAGLVGFLRSAVQYSYRTFANFDMLLCVCISFLIVHLLLLASLLFTGIA